MRAFASLLCLSFTLPSPALALRPQLNLTGLEEKLRPAAGAEEMGRVLQILDDMGIPAAGSEEAVDEIISTAGIGRAA